MPTKRDERRKENYRKLRESGFPSSECNTYKNYSRKRVDLLCNLRKNFIKDVTSIKEAKK